MPNIQLLPHQREAVDYVKAHPFCGLFLDVGLGKTAITLQALYELNEPTHVLIIAPKNIARNTWVSEIKKWDYPFRMISLLVDKDGKQLSKQEREERYATASEKDPTVYIANRDIIAKIVEYFTNKNNPGAENGWPFHTVIIDEYQSFKNPSSKRFKALRKVRNSINRLVGLTGTPTPNGLMDIWAEIFLLDKGHRLGETISKFRREYFIPSRQYENYFIDWREQDGAAEEVQEKIADVVVSMSNQCIKLPPLTFNDVVVKMSDDERGQYEQMAEEYVLPLITQTGEDIVLEASNAAVLTAKLRQMASGAIYTNRPSTTGNFDPDRDPEEYSTIHTHKLEALEEIVYDTATPILCAYEFHSDAKEILRYFNGKTRTQAVVFDGRPETLDAWNKREIPLLLIQPASAGHGLNFQAGGHTLVWYSLPWSLEEYLQTNGRLYRQGQQKPVVIHRILTQGTIDRRIIRALRRKDQDQQNLMDAVAFDEYVKEQTKQIIRQLKEHKRVET